MRGVIGAIVTAVGVIAADCPPTATPATIDPLDKPIREACWKKVIGNEKSKSAARTCWVETWFTDQNDDAQKETLKMHMDILADVNDKGERPDGVTKQSGVYMLRADQYIAGGDLKNAAGTDDKKDFKDHPWNTKKDGLKFGPDGKYATWIECLVKTIHGKEAKIDSLELRDVKPNPSDPLEFNTVKMGIPKDKIKDGKLPFRMRAARNFAKYPFSTTMTKENRIDLETMMMAVLAKAFDDNGGDLPSGGGTFKTALTDYSRTYYTFSKLEATEYDTWRTAAKASGVVETKPAAVTDTVVDPHDGTTKPKPADQLLWKDTGMKIVQMAPSKMENDDAAKAKKGQYFDGSTAELLRRRGKLFNNLAVDASFKSTGMNDAPDVGRGVFVMQIKDDITFSMWVGEEDHLRLSALQTTDDSSNLYKFFSAVVTKIQEGVQEHLNAGITDDNKKYKPSTAVFAQGEFGLHNVCISNNFTGGRPSIQIDLGLIPGISVPDTKKFLRKIGMDMRNQAGESAGHTAETDGKIDLYPRSRAGELFQVVLTLRNGINALGSLFKFGAKTTISETTADRKDESDPKSDPDIVSEKRTLKMCVSNGENGDAKKELCIAREDVKAETYEVTGGSGAADPNAVDPNAVDPNAKDDGKGDPNAKDDGKGGKDSKMPGWVVPALIVAAVVIVALVGAVLFLVANASNDASGATLTSSDEPASPEPGSKPDEAASQ